VIADCTGDNAGDSVGPTADGFETYGVTGVALITFLALALAATPAIVATLIIWLFVMRALMIVTSLVSYFVNQAISKTKYGSQKDFDFEAPLTHLVWITSAISIAVTFIASKLLLGDFKDATAVAHPDLWWVLSIIISCGTVAGAVIPEFTKIFVSTTSRHVREVTNCSKHGGASLNILSGFVAGNFSAFWMGLVIMLLMFTAYQVSQNASLLAIMPKQFVFAAPIFAFGLVAFGFLGMGPVTIAVDSYGPVTDNAQSVYELSQIEGRKGIKEEIKKQFGFEPDFENAKYQLEKGDGAGNTFKATAKPVLIGTAVVAPQQWCSHHHPPAAHVRGQPHLGGLQAGGGCAEHRATRDHPRPHHGWRGHLLVHRRLHPGSRDRRLPRCGLHQGTHETRRQNRVGKRQQGGRPHLHGLRPKRHVEYLHCDLLLRPGTPLLQSLFLHRLPDCHRVLRLFQAIFMANAGGAWDNAKKIVEVDLRQKGTDLHAATVVGDTVGDPFKDTSSVP